MTVERPRNQLLRINAIWAFISSDETGEGVCAMPVPGFGPVPMIAADEDRLNSLIPVAVQLAAMTGATIKLIKLSTREEVREFRPEQMAGAGTA